MERDSGGSHDANDDSPAQPVTVIRPADCRHAADGDCGAGHEMLQRIGAITRQLHDALTELGYHQSLSTAVNRLPDARERLAYIARVTGDSAEKVLSTVDQARAIQEQLKADAAAVAADLSAAAAAGPASGAEAAREADVRRLLASVDASTAATNAHLTEIMMAQDFHDLTGQVVRKVVDLAHTIEDQLVKLLVEASPAMMHKDKAPEPEGERLAGPVVNAEGRNDVVTDQQQVDDLLESLGF